MRILRALLGATVLLVLSSAGYAQTFTQLQWGIARPVTPSPVCVMNGAACLTQVGTISSVNNWFTPFAQYWISAYGAKPDGTDVGSALQSAVVAACANRGEVVIPAAQADAGWSIANSSTITITQANCPNGVTISGQGLNTGLISAGRTNDVFQVSTQGPVILRNMTIINFGTSLNTTAGAVIRAMSGGTDVRLMSVHLAGYWRGLQTDIGSSGVTMDHVVMEGMYDAQVDADGNGASFAFVNNSTFKGGATGGTAVGLRFRNGGGWQISNSEIEGHSDGISIVTPTTGGANTGIFASLKIDNTFVDSNTNHGLHSNPAGGTVQRITATGSWFGDNVGNGVYLHGNTQGFTCTGCELVNNGSNGLLVDANAFTTSINLSGGVAAQNTFWGAAFGAGIKGFSVTGMLFGPYDAFAANGGCATVLPGASDYYVIANNVCKDVNGVVDGGTGTNKIVALNAGIGGNIPINNFNFGTGASASTFWRGDGTWGSAVGSVSNSDGTLTISPTTGNVVASIALGHANTWSGVQTYSNPPIFSSLTGYLKANGASALTAAATVPLSDLATQTANTIVGNATAGSAAPTALAIGSCSTAASALTWTTSTGFGCNTSIAASVANPTASVGLAAVNGTATTAMRSDGAPALSQSIVPTWTGIHTFSAAPVFSLGAKYSGSSSGTVTVVASATAGTPTITWGNTSGTPAVTASAPLALSTTTGNMTVTGAAGQVLAGLTPAFTATPTLGVAGSAIGTLAFAGNTSGTATVTPQAAAGSPTLTLPNASGTFAVSATSPVAVSATTGNVTCTTCVTSSGGGAITGTAPVAVSAAGAVSITGAAGQVLAGASPAFTATPTLGVAGSTVGSLALANATSGSVTLQPVTGALGSAVLSLPATTSTLAALGLAQTWTAAQSFNSSDLKLNGATSGAITLNAAGTAGSNTITLPAGTTDFSATGGSNQVVKQTSSGGAFTVGTLACANLSDGATGCSTATGTSGATIPLNNANNTLSGNNTFQGPIASSVTPSSAWGIDCTGTTTGSIASAGTYTFQAGAGLIVIDGVATTGQAALFLIAGSGSVLVAQTGTAYANAVTGGKFSLTTSDTSVLLTNNNASAETFQICGQRVRAVAN